MSSLWHDRLPMILNCQQLAQLISAIQTVLSNQMRQLYCQCPTPEHSIALFAGLMFPQESVSILASQQLSEKCSSAVHLLALFFPSKVTVSIA